MPMSLLEQLESLNEESQEDEALLVQAARFTNWFLDTLEALNIDWEFIEGCPWIQFEATSSQLQCLMRAFSDITFEILE
jgi:hypothetical protein